MVNVNTRMVWLIILVILSYCNFAKSRWGNNVLKYGRKSVKIDILCANATFRMKNFDLKVNLYKAVVLNVNTRMVWLIIFVILSYSNVAKSGWGNNVLKYGSFRHF